MTLRSEIINKRRELSTEERIRLSDIITEKVRGLNEYKKADKVLVYADNNGEVATDKLINISLLEGKKVYAPVSLQNFELDFYRVFALDEMEPAAYGIREPLKIEYLKLNDNDVTPDTICITPGTVFDRKCNRMGYGKGYYDRFFARMKIENRIGLAFELQMTDRIDKKESDIPMTAVVTEENIWKIPKN